MNATKFEIRGLFERKSPVAVDLARNATIIYGINGSGKTTVLKLLNAVLTGKIYEIRGLPFASLRLFLSNNTSIVVTRTPAKNETKRRRRIKSHSVSIELISKNGTVKQTAKVDDDIELSDRVPYDMVEHEIPELERIAGREWLDRTSGDILSLNEVIEGYSYRIPWLQPSTEIVWYREIVKEFSVKFIQTQRLMTRKAESERRHPRHGIRYENTVIDYSERLRSLIRDKMSDSMKVSQDLDSTFPRRLLQGQKASKLKDKDLISLLEKTDRLGAKLREVDLLSSGHDVDIQFKAISQENRAAISLYLSDTYEKYKVMEPFADKLLLFLDIVNTMFHPAKEVKIGGSDGIVVKLNKGSDIHPSLLSSGEQHEIVLLFDLIFFSEPGTLVLIDEPEISLHIDWQKKFLSDVEAIGQAAGLRFVLATHSPAIIGNRIELCQEI